MNPLDKHSDFTTSNGNLDAVTSGSSWRSIRGTIGISSGKYYWEFTTGHNRVALGISTSQQAVLDSYVGDTSQGWSYFYSGDKYTASSNSSYGASYTAGDTIGVAFDANAGSIYFYKNGAIQNSGTAAYTGLTSGPYFPTFSFRDSGSTHSVNFGQRPFAISSVPTGYKSLCTTNLPNPTIADGSNEFNAVLRNGFGTSGGTVTVGFSPGLLWEKTRSSAGSHSLYDAVRGAGKILNSNNTNAESTDTNQVNSFTSTGYTVGTNEWSTSTTLVGWAWNAGTVANPVGDIWRTGATKYIGIKFASASGGTVSYGATAGSTTVEVWTSSDNSNWTQQGGTLTLSTGHTLTTSDQYVYIRNTSNGTFTDWYAAATNGADGHYSSATYPNGASWSGPTYTDFDWRDDGGTLNNDGNIPSIVRANPSAGFSIVTYTGTSSGGSGNIGHGLNATPDFIIFKSRDVADNWAIYHSSVGLAYSEFTTSGFGSGNATNRWSSLPTSSVIHLGSDTNINTKNHLIYAWSAVEGYSSFGSYTGNGSTDGVFIYTGFTPRWLLFKRHDSSSDWTIYDTARDPHNVAGNNLKPNTTGGETGPGTAVDILSNGFKFRRNSLENGGNDQYIYAAFAEHPFKTARAR